MELIIEEGFGIECAKYSEHAKGVSNIILAAKRANDFEAECYFKSVAESDYWTITADFIDILDRVTKALI